MGSSQLPEKGEEGCWKTGEGQCPEFTVLEQIVQSHWCAAVKAQRVR